MGCWGNVRHRRKPLKNECWSQRPETAISSPAVAKKAAGTDYARRQQPIAETSRPSPGPVTGGKPFLRKKSQRKTAQVQLVVRSVLIADID